MVQIVDRKGKATLIPDADILASALHRLPTGIVSDLGSVRRDLAREHGAEMCCPVTVQRLLVQFSEAGDTPYWRVVDANRPFAHRLIGGAERVRTMQASEARNIALAGDEKNESLDYKPYVL